MLRIQQNLNTNTFVIIRKVNLSEYLFLCSRKIQKFEIMTQKYHLIVVNIVSLNFSILELKFHFVLLIK